jgi:hypothetical protein
MKHTVVTFFLTNGHESVPISLMEKRLQKIAVTPGYRTRSYSHDTRSARSFAPATIQEDTSLLILAKSVAVEDSRLSKICALYSFQISQVTNKARLLNAHRGESGKVTIIVHQCRASWVGV